MTRGLRQPVQRRCPSSTGCSSSARQTDGTRRSSTNAVPSSHSVPSILLRGHRLLPGNSAAGDGATSAPTSHDRGEAQARSFPWLAWGITGVLAAGTLAVGGVALSENAALKDDRKKLGADPDELESKGSRVSTLAAVSDGLAVATLIAGGVSLWLTLDSPGRAEGRGAAGGLRLGLAPNQITLAGSLD